MDATLTGRDATEAIGLYMRLGAAEARFDASAVARAVRSSAGRARVCGALAVSRFVRAVSAYSPSTRPRAASSRRRRTVGAVAAASPGRPGGEA